MLASLVQCLFISSIRFSTASRPLNFADSEGYMPLHKLLHSLRDTDAIGFNSLGSLPNLANAAGVLALSPFFRLAKLGSASRVKLQPRHPRADLVIFDAARHVLGALIGLKNDGRKTSFSSCISISDALAILQSRFIGQLALDRVLEPAALLWAALSLRDARSSGISCAKQTSEQINSPHLYSLTSGGFFVQFCASAWGHFREKGSIELENSHLPQQSQASAEFSAQMVIHYSQVDAVSEVETSLSGEKLGLNNNSCDIFSPGEAIPGRTVAHITTASDVILSTDMSSRSCSSPTISSFDSDSNAAVHLLPKVDQLGTGSANLRERASTRVTAADSASARPPLAVSPYESNPNLVTGLPIGLPLQPTLSLALPVAVATYTSSARDVNVALVVPQPPKSIAMSEPMTEFSRRQQLRQDAWGFFGGFSGASVPVTLGNLLPASQAATALASGIGAPSLTGNDSVNAVQTFNDLDIGNTLNTGNRYINMSVFAGDELDHPVLPGQSHLPAPQNAMATSTEIPQVILGTLESLKSWVADNLLPHSSMRKIETLAMRIYTVASEMGVPPPTHRPDSFEGAEGKATDFFHVRRKNVEYISFATVLVSASKTHTGNTDSGICRESETFLRTAALIDIAAIRAQFFVSSLSRSKKAARTSSTLAAQSIFHNDFFAANEEGSILRDAICAALAPVLLDPAVLKIVHAGSDGIAWLQSSLGLFLVHTLDTHIFLDEMAASKSELSSLESRKSETVRSSLPEVSAADLRKREYSQTLAVSAAACQGDDAFALVTALERLRSLPVALQLAGLSTNTIKTLQQTDTILSRKEMIEEATGLLRLAGCISRALQVPIAGIPPIASGATCGGGDSILDLPLPLQACAVQLRAANMPPIVSRAGATRSPRDAITWHCASLRSEIGNLRTPPFDAFHLSSCDAPASHPPWYLLCSRCKQPGHFVEHCTQA